LVIAETTKSLVKGRLSNLRQIAKEQGFEIYSDEEREETLPLLKQENYEKEILSTIRNIVFKNSYQESQ
jgi:hypothetical protein